MHGVVRVLFKKKKKKEKLKYICSNGVCVVSKKNVWCIGVLTYFTFLV